MEKRTIQCEIQKNDKSDQDIVFRRRIFKPCYLYRMVAQNMLSTYKSNDIQGHLSIGESLLEKGTEILNVKFSLTIDA